MEEEEREAFDANGISAPFSKSGHHLGRMDGGGQCRKERGRRRTIFLRDLGAPLSQSSTFAVSSDCPVPPENVICSP